MSTIIKSIRGVNWEGSSFFEVGQEVNGLIIDKIEDISLENSNGVQFIYRGITSDGDLVLEIVNIPVEIQYELAKITKR
tara:strand:+ start:388 stop:624 length:237 start_codon:yes stop_codon:yes gene_type:complete